VREERDLFKASMHERLADYRVLKQQLADLQGKVARIEVERDKWISDALDAEKKLAEAQARILELEAPSRVD